MPKCPKCNVEMEELEEEFENMTEGQLVNYDAGFSRPFHCSKCKSIHLCDIEIFDILPDDAYEEIDDEINYEYFEDLINRAIEKRCFIEVISLTHNAIEFELFILLRDYIEKLENDEKELKTKFNILLGNKKKKYLFDYNETCYLLKLISKDDYVNIRTFNKKRNIVIHKLIKKDDSRKNRYRELLEFAKFGRKTYLKLLNYSIQSIKEDLNKFKITREEKFSDNFLGN